MKRSFIEISLADRDKVSNDINIVRLNDFECKEILKFPILEYNFNHNLNHSFSYFKIKKRCSYTFYINKTQDEWFYLTCYRGSAVSTLVTNINYMCDQIDGVIDCIKFLIDE